MSGVDSAEETSPLTFLEKNVASLYEERIKVVANIEGLSIIKTAHCSNKQEVLLRHGKKINSVDQVILVEVHLQTPNIDYCI